LEHPYRGLVQAPLDLAEVRIGQAGQLGELAERQVGTLALLADEGAERFSLRFPRVRHGGASSGSTAKYSTRQPRRTGAGAYCDVLVLTWCCPACPGSASSSP